MWYSYCCVVYNWTVDDVIHWLVNVVHLPQYSDNFRKMRIRGRDLPKCVYSWHAIQLYKQYKRIAHWECSLFHICTLHTHTRTCTHASTPHIHTHTLVKDTIPYYRIAINSEGIIQFDLGVGDSSHKKKLGLRAMDVILFGPPIGTEYIIQISQNCNYRLFSC